MTWSIEHTLTRAFARVEAPTFDASRERAFDELIARIVPTEPGARSRDLQPDLCELASRADALDEVDRADRSLTDETLALASRSLELCLTVRPAVARGTLRQMVRHRVAKRATGLGTYATDLAQVRALLRRAIEHLNASERFFAHVQQLLIGVAIEAAETVVVHDPALAPDAPAIHSPARAGTLEDVQAAAAAALAGELDGVTLEDWEGERVACSANPGGLGDLSTPESLLSWLLLDLYSLGRHPTRGGHVRALRSALAIIECLEEDRLPAIVAASATAIDGSGLGGGAEPWVATSLDHSITEAMLAVGPLAAWRNGDEDALALVTDPLTDLARRELVLLWWLAAEDAAHQEPGR